MGDRLAAPRLFVGRDAELRRLGTALVQVAFAQVVGLAGVGKSALVARFAASWRGPVLARRVAVAQRGAELLDELRRALGTPQPNLAADEDRVADLAALLDREATLLVLEEADRLDGPGKALLADLIAQLARARIVATSRVHVFPLGEGPERLQLVLDGLDRPAAEELWAKLDELYGTRDVFEQAWQRSLGNPFYLRRVHAGDHGADPLLSDTIAGLVADDRALAVALAVSDMPLAVDVAGWILPDARGDAALARLRACLVAERVGNDLVTIHDLMRAAMLQSASPTERREAHRQLAAALAGAALDPVVEVRERFHHLLAAGQIAAARALVLGRAPELISLGGSGELIRCLDALREADADDVEVRLARARVLGRMLDFRRAFEDLSHLEASRHTATDRVRASYAHVAMLTGRFDTAERISGAALTDPALELPLRIRHATIWVMTRTYQGHGGAARAWIAGLLRGVADPLARGLMGFLHAFSCWLEERDAEAEEAMRAAWVFLARERTLRAHVLGSAFWVTVLARIGKIEEARQALEQTEAALERFEDPLLGALLGALRASWLDSKGDFAAALAEITGNERRWSHGGHAMALLWARLHRGELLLRLGRVRQGHHVLDDVAREAAAAGAELLVRQAALARRADPVRGMLDERTRSARPGEIRRDRVLTALRSIARGELTSARGHLAALTGDDTLDELERALCVLAEAALARDDGDPRADPLLTRAVELAARAEADPELIVDIDRHLRDAAARSRTDLPIVVDRERHELRVADQIVAFGSRPALRKLLYALLAEPGGTLDKASLAAAVWSTRYRPERHDSALWVNLTRLRDLLHRTGLSIVTDPGGYRIAIAEGYQLVAAGARA